MIVSVTTQPSPSATLAPAAPKLAVSQTTTVLPAPPGSAVTLPLGNVLPVSTTLSAQAISFATPPPTLVSFAPAIVSATPIAKRPTATASNVYVQRVCPMPSVAHSSPVLGANVSTPAANQTPTVPAPRLGNTVPSSLAKGSVWLAPKMTSAPLGMSAIPKATHAKRTLPVPQTQTAKHPHPTVAPPRHVWPVPAPLSVRRIPTPLASPPAPAGPASVVLLTKTVTLASCAKVGLVPKAVKPTATAPQALASVAAHSENVSSVPQTPTVAQVSVTSLLASVATAAPTSTTTTQVANNAASPAFAMV